MAIQGRQDDDNSKKASLAKAQANGFGQEGVAGRPRLNTTEMFEERAADRLPGIIDGMLTAWERALASGNTKLAADTATKVARIIYNPDQKIVVEGADRNEVHNNILVIQDGMTPKEIEALKTFQNFLGDTIKEEEKEQVIEGELLGED